MKIESKVEWRYVLDWLKDHQIIVPARIRKEFIEVLNESIYHTEEKP